MQWRYEFEWLPTAKFKWRPYKVYKLYCLQKKEGKKGRATLKKVFL